MTNMKTLSSTVKKLKDFLKVGQRSQSISHVQNLWYHHKGLVVGNTKKENWYIMRKFG